MSRKTKSECALSQVNEANHDDASSSEPAFPSMGLFYGAAPNKVTNLYRGDTRPPKVIFKKGFVARGRNMDVSQHYFNFRDSGYVSATTSEKVALPFAFDGETGWFYSTNPQADSIDIEAVMGTKKKYNLKERIVPHQIKPGDIIEARKATWLPSGEMVLGKRIPNPNWVPPSAAAVYPKLAATLKIIGHSAAVVGVAFDGANLYFAYQRTLATGDSQHVTKETMRIAGGWSGAIALGTAFAKASVFYLAPMGPLAEITGSFVAGVVGSVAGYLGGEAVVKEITQKIMHVVQNPFALFIPVVLSGQLHGETKINDGHLVQAAKQNQSPEEKETHEHPPEAELEKQRLKDAIKVDFQHPPQSFTTFLKKATFVGNAMEVHDHTMKKYPDTHSRVNAACSAAQVIVEEFIKDGAAAVAASVVSVPTAGIPNPGSACAAAVGYDAAKPIAKKIGNAVNDGLHYVFGAQKPRAVSAHPSRRSAALSMYRGETKNRQNKYEQSISGINSFVRNQAESHRKYFAKMGMLEPQLKKPENIRAEWHRGLNVGDGTFTEWMINEAGEYISLRLPVARAEAGAKTVVIRRSRSQPKSQRSAFHMQRQFLNEGISSPAKTTTSAQPKTAISHARTNAVTNLRNSTQLDDLKISLQKTNVALRERQEAAQVAQYNAQRQVETLCLAGEVCSLASRVCRYCGDDDTAQFFSSTFSLYSSFFALIAAPSPLAVIGLVMNFVGFFISNRAAEEARRFAMMIAAASRSTENMRDDVITEIREFQRLAQHEIRLVGAKLAESLAAQNQLHQSHDQVFSGLAIFQQSLGEYFEKTNAYMNVLTTLPLKTACDDLLSYLDKPTETTPFTIPEIKTNLRKLKFWIESRLHHPVMNYTVYLNLPESEAISILSSQPHTLLIMPSFVAGRAQIALREKALLEFLSLPPMMPYFATIRLLFRVLEKHPEFLMDDKFSNTFTQIQETLTTFSELLTLLKNNEENIPSDIVNMVREVDLYQAVIAEMKNSITYYQKRLHYLTDPLQQLNMFARNFFNEPENQTSFWKKQETTSHPEKVFYVISCDEFKGDSGYASNFLNQLHKRGIPVRQITTVNGERMYQVSVAAKSVPNIMPSIPNKCASFFFNSTHQRDPIGEIASSTSTTRHLQ